MVCPSQNNVDTMHTKRLQKYQQLTFKISGRQPEYNVMIIPIVIDCLGRGIRHGTKQIGRLISDKKKTRATSNKIVKIVLSESESITKKCYQD